MLSSNSTWIEGYRVKRKLKSEYTGASETFKGRKVNNNFRKDIQVKDSIFVALAQGQDVVCLGSYDIMRPSR